MELVIVRVRGYWGSKYTSLRGTILETISYVTMFLLFFPRKFIEEVMIKEMNQQLKHNITLGEFLRYIGLWLIIVRSEPGNLSCGKFWSKKQPDRKKGAPF